MRVPLSAQEAKDLRIIDRTGMIKVGDRERFPGLHFCPENAGRPVCDRSGETCGCQAGK